MTPAILRRVGEALYGPRWQSDMARALKINDSARIREWMRGARPIPDLTSDLLVLLDERQREQEEVRALLREST